MTTDSAVLTPGTVLVQPGDPRFPCFPSPLPGLGPPLSLQYIGSLDLLAAPKVAILCSQQCPGSIILKTYDLMQSLKLYECVIAGGFHSPMEQECMRILLNGRSRMVACPAHSIGRMRIPSEWRPALTAGRLLIVSPFAAEGRRSTARVALERNHFVAALADLLFVPHAATRSRTEGIVRATLARKRPVFTFEDPENRAILELGAVSVESLIASLPPVSSASSTFPLDS